MYSVEKFIKAWNTPTEFPTIKDIAEEFGVSERTVKRWAAELREQEVELLDRANRQASYWFNKKENPQEELELYNPDEEIVAENIRIAKQLQKARDENRVKNKSFRERARAENLVEELNRELNALLKKRSKMYPVIPKGPTKNSRAVGVVQLSDLHFGEIVSETLDNRFDMDIASRRLKKLAERSRTYFKSQGIKNIAVFLTGDIINSTRRISEITTYADARVKVVFNAYLILGNFLEDLYQDFNITVASVVGNESRLAEYFDTTNYLVSDNFDLMLHMMLQNIHEKEGMQFLDIHKNPTEQVVNVNGVNFLLVHGNIHKGLATTPKIETEVGKLKSRYASAGIKIDYVICGHIHSTFISNTYARSASLVGSNAFSERTLNFTSKAAQNAYVVLEDGSVDGIMIDLQHYDGYEAYPYDKENIRYFNDTEKGTVVIQSVLV